MLHVSDSPDHGKRLLSTAGGRWRPGHLTAVSASSAGWREQKAGQVVLWTELGILLLPRVYLCRIYHPHCSPLLPREGQIAVAGLRLAHPSVSFTSWVVSDCFMVSLGLEIENSIFCRKRGHRKVLVSASVPNWVLLGTIWNCRNKILSYHFKICLANLLDKAFRINSSKSVVVAVCLFVKMLTSWPDFLGLTREGQISFFSFFSPRPGQNKKNVFHTILLSPHYLKVTNFQSFITLSILVTFLVPIFDLLFSVSITEQIFPFYNVVVLLHYCVQSVLKSLHRRYSSVESPSVTHEKIICN